MQNSSKCVLEKDQKSFAKKIRAQEFSEYTETVKKALELLDKKIDIIIHGASFPSETAENIGLGSPFSNGAKRLTTFLKKHGITGIQLGPEGLLKPFDPSPYMSSLFSKNVLFTDLKRLTQLEGGKLLSVETFNKIVEGNPNKEVSRANFGYVFPQFEIALRESFENFKVKSLDIKGLDKSEAQVISEMKDKFEAFKLKKEEKLEKDSIYAALTKKYNNDYWPVWEDQIDKNLFNPKSEEEAKSSAQRVSEIKEAFSDEIEFFMFKQFLVNEDKELMKEYNLKNGIKSKADVQVAYSDMDVWANQALFKDGWFLGCPPDAFSKTGQAWGFPVLDPEKIFNADGSFGEAGKFLYDKFKDMFMENAGGVRIDHVIGLIDPFVYKAGTLPLDKTSGRLYSSPDKSELAKYAKNTADQYADLFDRIIIPAAKEAGLGKSDIICEDLGTLTDPVVEVMKRLDLPGIRVTEFFDPKEEETFMYRGINAAHKDVIMPGSHDNSTIIEYAAEIMKSGRIHEHARCLAEDLLSKEVSESDRNNMVNEIAGDQLKFIRAKMVEILASPAQQVQFFFTDIFGMEERYNMPGTSGDKNWSLRLPENFEDFYHEKLKNNQALNFPEILKMAIESKGSEFVKNNQELFDSLEMFSKSFKED